MPLLQYLWRWIRQIADLVWVVCVRFYRDRGLNEAASLAYSTLLSVVPLLALMFALLRGLGAQSLLQPILLERLVLDHEVAQRIIGYIDNTNISGLGFLGAAALFVTVISLLGGIESSFNQIWRVRRSRSTWRQIADFISVVFLTPVLLLIAAAITSSLQFQQIVQWMQEQTFFDTLLVYGLKGLPILINALAIGVLYSIMPNRRAAPVPLVIAALVAGTIWQVVQSTYVGLQFGLARYTAIYRGLAQLPFLLIWLYVSWVVILGGAHLAAVLEFGRSASGRHGPRHWLTAVALEILLSAADAFQSGSGPTDATEIGRRLGVPHETVEEALSRMEDLGWLVPTSGAPGSYTLGLSPDRIGLGILALERQGLVPDGCDPRVAAFAAAINEEGRAFGQRWLLEDLRTTRAATKGGAGKSGGSDVMNGPKNVESRGLASIPASGTGAE